MPGNKAESTHSANSYSTQELLPQLGVTRVVGRNVECSPDHAARTVRHVRAQFGDRQRLDAARDTHPIGRRRKIGCGIGQCSIEVEQDQPDAVADLHSGLRHAIK